MNLPALTATAVVFATVSMIWASGGWLRLPFLVAALIAGLIHVVLRSGHSDPAHGNSRLGLLADAAFFMSFAIQVDEGDGPKYLVIEGLLPDALRVGFLPYWWPGPLHLIVFAVLIYFWLTLAKTNR